TSKFFLDENHQKLYLEGNAQKFNKKEGGFVSIEFIEGANKDEKNQNYPPAVLCTIKEVLGHGYNPEDIVILVRKNEMGVEIASFLADNGIQVSSSEALIIEGSPQVRAVLDVLRLVANFGNQKAKADLLGYLYEHVRSDEERSEERRVGKECRSWWLASDEKESGIAGRGEGPASHGWEDKGK